MSAVQFDVAYRVGEYLGFVLEHGRHLRGKPLGIVGRAVVSLVAVPAFLVKSARIGPCSFVIDESGIIRTSRLGKLPLPWAEVLAVHRYSPGLLIEKRGGAVPIPYRCLTPSQRECVEELVGRWEAWTQPLAGPSPKR